MRPILTTIRFLFVAGFPIMGAHGTQAQDWPQWRGPNRDARVGSFTAPAAWPKELKLRWRIVVGKGDASPALVGDRVYVFARQGDDEVTTCVEAATGRVNWTDRYAAQRVVGAAINMWGSQGGPRSSPAVAEGKICTYGIAGVLSCLDATSGQLVWRRQSTGKPIFYTASSPMIVDGKCIAFLTTNKGGALTAFDLTSGEPRWEWTGASEPYGSPVLMTVDGTQTIVTPTDSGLVGVGLADGKLRWQVPFGAKNTYQLSLGTPILDGTNVIYFCPSGIKQGGSMAVAIEKHGESFAVKELWRKEQSTGSFSTPVLKDGLLFGVNSSCFCMDAKTGEVLWRDMLQRFGNGAIVDAGTNFFSLNIDRNLVAFKGDRKGYVELASYKAADSATWAYPIISGNRVYVKDTDTLTLWTVQ